MLRDSTNSHFHTISLLISIPEFLTINVKVTISFVNNIWSVKLTITIRFSTLDKALPPPTITLLNSTHHPTPISSPSATGRNKSRVKNQKIDRRITILLIETQLPWENYIGKGDHPFLCKHYWYIFTHTIRGYLPCQCENPTQKWSLGIKQLIINRPSNPRSIRHAQSPIKNQREKYWTRQNKIIPKRKKNPSSKVENQTVD